LWGGVGFAHRLRGWQRMMQAAASNRIARNAIYISTAELSLKSAEFDDFFILGFPITGKFTHCFGAFTCDNYA
jgi:hypothetical protein